MKKNIRKFIALAIYLIVFINYVQGQFVLEHTYDSSAFILRYVNFRFNGEKYARMYYTRSATQYNPTYYIGPRRIDLYNLNHSLWKTIPLTGIHPFPDENINSVSGNTCEAGTILYLSDGLFNNDSLVEFLYSYETQIEVANLGVEVLFRTFIYNENGALLFSDTTAGPWYTSTEIPETYLPVFNTSQGTKMILSSGYPDYVARVYGLAGELTDIESPSGPDIGKFGNLAGMNIYPNPAKNYTTVQYELPADVSTAQLVFYSMDGARVKSFTVDHSFQDLLISTDDLAAGAYYCQIETANGPLPGKKLVKIN